MAEAAGSGGCEEVVSFVVVFVGFAVWEEESEQLALLHSPNRPRKLLVVKVQEPA